MRFSNFILNESEISRWEWFPKKILNSIANVSQSEMEEQDLSHEAIIIHHNQKDTISTGFDSQFSLKL